ncbi:MAG: sugar phosphate isomerase/epimerase family protein [Anaerolineae bacterium]
MHLSCWTALFPGLPWTVACRLIAALGFTHVDLMTRSAAVRASTPWDGLDLEELVIEPEQSAEQLRSSLAGLELASAALNVAPAPEWFADQASGEAGMRALAVFCRCAGIPLLALAASDLLTHASRAADVARLRRWLAIVTSEGGQLAVEPNCTAVARTPTGILRLVGDVPGLGMVMDPAHQIVQGFHQEDLDPLWPYARHVHARQARPGYLQARLAGGTIDFAAVGGSLQASGYDGAICVENILLPDAAWLTSDYLDPVAETVALRDLLWSLL